MSIFAGTPLVQATDDGTTLKFADQLYVPGQGEFDGPVRCRSTQVSTWLDNTPTNMNAGVDTVLMANATQGTPQNAYSDVTFSGGTFRFHTQGAVQVTFVTTGSTSAAQAKINFEFNGAKVRTFYTPVVPASTALNPICCTHYLLVHDTDTFRVLSSPVTGATLNTAGVDGDGQAQTYLFLTYCAF